MAFTAIPDNVIDPDSPVTTGLMTDLRDNDDYLKARLVTGSGHTHDQGGTDEGGPVVPGDDTVTAAKIVANAVGQSEMADNAIGQAELKDALQQSTGTGISALNYTGGAFTLGFGLAGGTGISLQGHTTSAYTWGIGIFRISGTHFWQSRYFQASPPYDMGNGEIPLFVFATVDNATREIEAVDIAPDPPWAYSGPTDIRPDFVDKATGKKYKNVPKTTLDILGNIADTGKRAAMFAQLRSSERDVVEVTPEFKNADIDIVSHPFMGNDLSGKTVILLDPTGSAVDDLGAIWDKGENVAEIARQYINVGNTDIGINKPAGVMLVSANWK